MPGTHALLSPSAAHRWLNCTAAPRLEENQPDAGSDFALEGTLAHAYCAKRLKEYLGLPTGAEKLEIEELSRFHTGEMDEYVETYAAIVLEKYNAARAQTKDALLLVEQRLDFSKYVPEAFGTGDAIIIADGVLDVIDFKYGKGVRVEAEGNPQMRIYALGAYDAYSFEYDIRHVRMTIVQPRIDNLSEAELAVADLLAWARGTLVPKAREAYDGRGVQTAGEWCQFCKVKSQCKVLSDICLGTVATHPEPRLVSPADMAQKILPQISIIKTWLAGIEDFALAQALSGVHYDGYKIVEGRSVRKITDPVAVREVLYGANFSPDDFLKPTELRSLTDLEKLVGKKRFAELCGGWIEKPQGKPTLVPESDKRAAIDPVADDFKDINE